MHNWWIAAFESAGIWTKEQAQHVSDNIKTSLHREQYPDALAELNGILTKGEFGVPSLTSVEARVQTLESTIKDLRTLVEKAPEGHAAPLMSEIDPVEPALTAKPTKTVK